MHGAKMKKIKIINATVPTLIYAFINKGKVLSYHNNNIFN